MRDLEIWGHRGGKIQSAGNSLADNTSGAFKMAYDCGVDGVEADIDQTRDGEPIIYHLKTLKPDPINLDWTEVKSRYPFIMHFEDFLFFLSNHGNIRCSLDMKNDSEKFLKKLILRIKAANLQERIFITASQFKIKVLQLPVGGKTLLEARNINPASKTHVIGLLPHNLDVIAKKFRVDAVSLGWLSDPFLLYHFSKFVFQRCINTKFSDLQSQIKRLRSEQVKVWGGIANTFEEMDYFVELGVNGIFTDEVALAMKYKN